MSHNATPNTSRVELRKTLTLVPVVRMGLAYMQPMTLFDTFGIVSGLHLRRQVTQFIHDSRALQRVAEGVALRRVAAIETAFKPGIALLRRSVGKAVRYDAPLALLLQAIVANRLCGIQRFLQIAGLHVVLLLHVVAPDAGKAVRL